MQTAYIALGSNLQQPSEQIKKAFSELKSLPKTRLIKQSSLYRTAPVGYDNQPDFINAVAQVETALTPRELLRALLALEAKHGRERPFPNAPRVLDLDLLLYGTMAMTTEELTLPHPRMHERGFVLMPLAEIAPDLVLHRYGKVSTLAKASERQGVEKVAPK